MIYFDSDYSEGAHTNIIKALNKTNFEQTLGYGEDKYSKNASDLIRKACNNKEVSVHFLVGGTQTNKTVIAASLRPNEAVICPSTGHINEVETGAIEATGHKVLTLPSKNGKITATQIEETYNDHYNLKYKYHFVKPRMVCISNSTELGTIYKKDELTKISNVCKKLGLYLYIDGARLGYALASNENDLSLEEITALCDIFYIGGTKVGALFGEAVVIVNDELKKDFKYIIKQNGALLAKGRLLGIQFCELFKNNLYFEISKNGNYMANKIKNAFKEIKSSFLVESQTNLQFPILQNSIVEKLSKKYCFSLFEKIGDKTVVRFATSWATKESNVDLLIDDILKLK